jgi:hypothetical protein
MSDIIVIQPSVTQLTVTEDTNQVVVSSVGVQGPAGATGATGATGAAGASGVVAVTAPITNSGTSSAANIGLDQSNIALKYASPWQVKYRSGYFYEPQIGCVISTSPYTINRLFYVPLFLPESITMDRIGAECVTAVASSTFRLGLYNSDADGLPSSLVFDAGTIDTSSTGLKTITISQTVSTPGLYFLAYAQQGGATQAVMRALAGTSGNWSPVAGTTMGGSNHFTSYYQDSVSGAFPSTPTLVGPNTLNPMRMQFRVA